MTFYQFVPFSRLEVLPDHFGDEFLEGNLRRPAQFFPGLGGISQERLHFRRPEVTGIDAYDGSAPARRSEVAHLVDALSLPVDLHAQFFGCGIDEIADAVLDACGDDEIIGTVLLQHEPLHLYVVPCMAPIPESGQIAEIEGALKSQLDPGKGAGDLPCHKGFAANRRLVVEEDTVAGIDAVCFTVVYRDPVGVNLGAGIGAPGVEGRGLFLGDLLHFAEKLGCGSLVESGLLLHTQDTDGLEDAKRPYGIGIGRVLRLLEGDGNMGLGSQIVDLRGLCLLDDPDKTRRVGEVAVVEDESAVCVMRVLV